MAAVMIGIDPHKASHTAVAISAAEEPLGELRVRACAAQASSCWRRVSGCWMCNPSWARGCGCWPPGM